MGVNVNFKRGTQANLLGLGTYVDGTFYLTTDTNRLYFCQSGTLVDLNQYIHMTTISETDLAEERLPKTSTSGYANLQAGDIYYWSNVNILAICDNPSTGAWTQLNPDTYLKASNQNMMFSTTNNQVTVTSTVQDAPKGNQSKGTFTLAGGSNVTLSESGGVITINSTDTTANYTYSLNATTSSQESTSILNLNGANGGTTSSVNIVGTGSVGVSTNSNGDIVIDGSGGLNSMAPKINSSGGLYINYSTTDGTANSAIITPTFAYGENASTTAAFVGGIDVTNPTVTLDVYTQAEVRDLIDDAKQEIDSMTYKGVVTSSNYETLLSTTASNVGDTYKADSSWTFPAPDGRDVNIGDLLIAKGSDGNVTWDIIPSGDDQTISGGAVGNGIWISDQSGTSASPAIAGIVIDGSTTTYGTISVANNIVGHKNTLTVSHGAAGTGTAVTIPAATTATTMEYSLEETPMSIPVITGISKDAAGHITDVSAATYVVKDTHNYITSIGIASSATNNQASVTVTLNDHDQNAPKQATFRIRSDNLEVTSTSADGAYNVTANFVWGTF